ncbi:pseudouridine synthase [Pavlovales sp. CCMP2436]|nr:pseudouridine synthase [Pavlovales sp. CCMP2436]
MLATCAGLFALAVGPQSVLRHDARSAAAALSAWRQAERAAVAATAVHIVAAVPASARASRVAHYAATVAFPDTLHTASAVNAACKEGRLLIGGARIIGARRVVAGEALELALPDQAGGAAAGGGANPLADTEDSARLCVAFNVLADCEHHAPALCVLYEDEHMAIVQKPAGIHTVSWAGTERARTFALDALLPLALSPPDGAPDALPAPLPVHRLDARVAGPVVVAKTRGARVALGRAFEPRGGALKVYRALVCATDELGHAPAAVALAADGRLRALDGGWFSLELEVDGRDARTNAVQRARTPCAVYGALADVELHLATGRRHQLRRACEALGAPILGDDLYPGGVRARRGVGLFLYCASVTVPHPAADGRAAVRAEMAEPPRFGRQRAKARIGWDWLQAHGVQRDGWPPREAVVDAVDRRAD